MTKLFIFLLPCLFIAGCVHSPPKAIDDIEQWETSLKNVKGSEADEDNAEGGDAYRHLIQSGPTGYKVLSDAWVRGNIWLESWVQWEHDFMTRYSMKIDKAHDEVLNEYAAYVEQRLLEEPDYFHSALEYLASEQGYKRLPLGLAYWLATGTTDLGEPFEVGRGHRKVAYSALKKIDPQMPKYDPDASAEIRAKQYKQIEAYFIEKDAETQEPSAPNNPFSN